MPDPQKCTHSILVDLASGQLLQASSPVESRTSFEDFAAASADLFSAVNVSWDTLFSALDTPPGDLEFQDLVLVGDRNIFVAQRLAADPGLALLSIVPAEKGVGLAVSEARDQVLSLLSRG